MAASAAQVTRLRRMVAETTDTTYSDTELATVIEQYSMVDAEGREPSHDDWEATYDLHRAAAEVWDEKAAALAGNFDFNADGATYHRSQAYEQALKSARQHMSKRAAISVPLHTTFEGVSEWPVE